VTPAVKTLKRLAVDHSVVEYAHDPAQESYGTEAVAALGVDGDYVFKTLVVMLDGTQPAVGVIPVDQRLNLKAIATAANAKKASMADRLDAERVTGYVLGGISPVGQKRRLPTFIDDSACDLDKMYVSGGRRGLELILAPSDLACVTGASFAPLGVSPKL